MDQINYAAHIDQRVAVFIDTQNLYHSAKANYRSNVNYHELMDYAVHGRKLIRAFAYVIKSEESTEEKFFDALEEIGIEIRVKDLQVFHTGAKKADWDVGIAVDMIRLTEKVDVVVLASGDGDFLEVVRYCKSRGVRVEVMAFEKTTNAKLMEEADNFVDLGDSNSEFLISSRKRTSRTSSYANKYVPSQYPSSQEGQNQIADQAPLPANYRQYETSASPSPAAQTIEQANGQFGGSNLSSVNRQMPKTEISPSIYGQKNYRKIRPVVGLPAKPNPSSYSGKILVNDETKHKKSIENAFGNPMPKAKKKYF